MELFFKTYAENTWIGVREKLVGDKAPITVVVR